MQSALGRSTGHRRMLHIVVSLVLLVAVSAQSAPPPLGPAPASAEVSTLDTPTALVGSGVTDFFMAAPKVFWHTAAYCPPIIKSAGQGVGVSEASDPEVVSRIATYGGLTRQLFNRNEPRNAGVCNPYHFYSNIVADASFVYWIDSTGLVKLSTDANPGDPLTLVAGSVTTNQNYKAELAIDANNVYAITHSSGASTTIQKIVKASGAVSTITTIAAYAGNLQTGGGYLYWLVNQNLMRYDPAAGGAAVQIGPTGISGYHSEGSRIFCSGIFCLFTNNVYMGKGNQVLVHNNVSTNNASTSLIYTSSDATAAPISLVTSGENLFIFERRTIPCQGFCFPSYNYWLIRTTRSAGGAVDVLASYSPGLASADPIGGLGSDGTFLFWRQGESVQRLPNNAAALPLTNMRVTGMEVTQGVQRLDNSVILIQNRRTFVRVYVKSDGPPVSGVTAYLYLLDNNNAIAAGPLVPANPAGTKLTVQSNPQRNDINQSFLFELPWSWVSGTSLKLQAVLNPNQVPLQASYANNSLISGPFTLKTSPRLQVQFVSFGYILNNTYYYPRFVKDIIQTYSWIRRAYPLASKPGFFTDPSPGLRTNLWIVVDDGLDEQVVYPVPCPKAGCDNLRATAYAISQVSALRSENGVPNSTIMYGLVTDSAGFFPRGQDDTINAAGPAGSGTWGWDNDGSYADWYAGHEIGHALGRGHPTASGDSCGNSKSDDSYPYTGGAIGPSDGSLEGFDVGDAELGLPLAVYPGTTWFDMMTYCNNQWISDYTYKAIYDYMIAHPGSPGVQALAVAGDWLSISGTIYPGSNAASLDHVRRLASVGQVPTRTPGAYAIRLLSASSSVLADYAFTPLDLHGSTEQIFTFGQVVPWVAGTTKVQIIRVADSQVLGSVNVSANPPVVSNVSIPAASNPVTGTVSLAWTASDPDGDALTFDVLYSRDDGANFQTLRTNASSNPLQIDTSTLGGGSAIFRVIASDGVLTGSSDSPSYTLANKPPDPHITTPGNGAQYQYGQVVNFSGSAADPQDGGVADSGLTWTYQKGTLGTGALLSSTSLPVGTNYITLTAKNSAGLSASTSITVVVGDDLNLPTQTLSVGPSSLGWHVAAGTTAVQSSQLAIGNTGSGTLNWTASTDAAWLTLGAASGTAPSTMTVSTNPTGLAAGTILSGTVTIQTTGLSPTQTIQVPVSLSIGDVHALAVPVEPAATPTPTSTPSNSATATAIASQPTPTATPVAGTPAASFKDYVSIVLNGQIAGW